MPVVADHEKVFKYFLHFPEEIRIMVVDEMPPMDKGRFQGCSMLSQQLVRCSKQKIFALHTYFTSDYIRIRIQYGKDSEDSFELKFESKNGVKSIQCVNFDKKEMWKIQLGTSEDLFHKAIGYFKMYHKSIRTLYITHSGGKLPSIDFEVETFKNLEKLHSAHLIDVSQFLLKTQRPLETLCSFGDINLHLVRNSEKISSVSRTLIMPKLKLNNEQFLKLSASEVEIHIGELTVDDIHNFTRLWQNGEIRDNLQECRWKLIKSRFKVNQLFRRFTEERIRSLKEVGTFAELGCSRTTLYFQVHKSQQV